MKNNIIKFFVKAKKVKKFHLALLLAFTLLSSAGVMAGVRYFSSEAAGNSCTWIGGTDTNWDTAANWGNCNSTFPDATDNISFPNAATYDLIMTSNKTVASVSALSAGAFNKIFNTNGYALTANGDFTWQKGTLTTGASDITVSGNLDLSAGTFNYNSSNIILIGNASNLTPKADNSLSFYNLTINKGTSATAVTVQTSNFNVRNILNAKKGKFDGVGRTITMSVDNSRYQIGPDSTGGSANIKFSSTGYVDASGGSAADTIEMNSSGKTLYWNGSANLKYLTLTDGTLNIQSGKLTFPASADGSAGKLSCAAGKTLTMAGTSAGSLVILRSATSGSAFYLENNCGATTANYVDIKDANNTSGTIAASNSIDSDNNTGFDFATTPLVVNKWISDTESNWNNAANWSLGTVPASTDNVYFGQGHNGNCNQDVAAGVTVANVVSADYAGTFNGGSSNITLSTSLGWTSGTLTSTSGTLSIAHSFRHSAGIFNHNSGTVTFFAGSDWSRVIDVPSTEIFNNMSHNTDPNYGGISIAHGDTLVVNGALNLIAGALYGGTIDLNGTISNAAIRGGNTSILIDNPGQTLNISGGWVLPGIDLRAGILNAPASGTMTISGSYLHSGGTFNNSSSTIRFTTSSAGLFIDVPANETFFNLDINTDPNYGGVNIPAGHTITVSGTLSLNTGCLFGGSVDVNGSLISSSNFRGGNTNLLINDSNQTINIQDGWVLPTLNISAGTVNAPSGLMTIISGNFIHSGGTFNHNSGTLKFVAGYPGRLIDVPGSETLNNLIFDTDPNYGAINIASGDLLVVSSKLTLTNGTLVGGAIEVKGDLEAQPGHDGCTTDITLTGTGDQTYTLSSGVMPSGDLTINKPSGKATITGTGTLKGNIALTAGQLDFAGGNAYTMMVGKSITASAGTRLNFNGSVGNLVTFDSSDASTAINITKPDGIVIGDYVNMNHTNVSGGAKFYSTPNFTGANNTGWTTDSANIRTISAAGGNWSDTAAWNEGAVPTNADNVLALSGSGNITVDNTSAVAKTVDLTSGYANTLTLGTNNTLTVSGSVILAPNRVAANNGSTLAMNTSGTLISAGNTLYNLNANASGGTVTLGDGLITNSAGTVTLTSGTLNTDGGVGSLTHSWGFLNGMNSNTKTLTLGASNIDLAGAGGSIWLWHDVGSTFNCGTSTITFSGSNAWMYHTASGANAVFNNVIFNGPGTPILGYASTSPLTFGTLTRTGTASKTDVFSIWINVTVTGTININGNSTTNRLLVQSGTLGTARTITANAVALSNADFQDIAFAGTMTVNSATLIGDCGGNSGTNWSGIVTPAATQTWTNAAGGNWSDAANWSGRVPLPQDDVNMAKVGGYNSGVTVTADMPRLGKSIDWTGATWAGTPVQFRRLDYATSYGSLTFIPNMTFGSYDCGLSFCWAFAGRGSHSITSAGLPMTRVSMEGLGTYTLNDDFTSLIDFRIYNGTFNANNHNLLIGNLTSDYSNINMGSGVWNVNRGGFGVWNVYDHTTLNSSGSTVFFSDTASGSTTTISAGGKVYNNISISPSPGEILFANAFTFNNMTMSSAGAKTVKFTKDTTYTMTGTNFLSGSAGNLVTIDTNDGTGTFTLNKTSGMAVADYVNVSRATVQGGAKWYLTPNSTQADCTGWDTANNNIRTVSAAGGNWGDASAWNEGVVPAAADEVYALPGSGALTIAANAVARNVNFYNYLGTLTHNAATSLSVGDASGGYLDFSGNWTYTLGNATTSAINFVSTNNNSGNGWPITWGGKTPGNITINGSGGSWIFQDALNASATLTLIHGNLNTNNQTLNLAGINSSLPGAPYPVLTLGSSVITLGYWMNSYSNGLGGFTLNADTSTFYVSTKFNANGYSYNNVIFNGAGTPALVTPTSANSTFANLSRIGTATKTDGLEINSYNNGTGQIVVNGTLNIAGNSSTNRLLIKSGTLGTARTITAANVNISNADYMDITAAGAANWDLSAISGGSGDCGGNTGITFTPGVTQTWTNAAGGNWSDAANWSGRVPLPQDDVNMARVGGYNSGVTVTADMSRLGKSIDWTGATWTGTATTFSNGNMSVYNFGSLTFIPGITFFVGGGSAAWYLAGRSNYILTSATRSFYFLYISAPNGTYTLADPLAISYGIFVNAGNFNTAGNNVTTGYQFYSTGSTTRSINITNSIVTITAGVANFGWKMADTGLTLTTSGSTISLAAGNIPTFNGGTKTYNNIQFAPGGTTNISGAFTFNNMTMSSVGAKTVKFAKNTTYTMTGTNFLSGSNGNLVTIDSDDAATNFTLTKSSGLTVADYVNVSRATVQGGAKWYLTPNSTQTSCSGWDTTNNNIRTVSAAGGNWDAPTAWNEGIVPAAADEVYALLGSGNLTVNVNAVARNLNCYNYIGTLTHNAAIAISVGDASGGYLNFAGAWTYTKGDAATSSISFISTNNNGTNGWPITWGGKTPGNITFNAVGGKWKYQDGYTNTSQELTLTAGELDVNGQTFSFSRFTPSNSASAIMTLTGNSNLTLAHDWGNNNSAWVLNKGSSTITMTGTSKNFWGGSKTYNNVVFAGSDYTQMNTASTFANLTRTGTASKTDRLVLTANQVVTGTLTISGNSATNRLLIQSNTLGTARTITANAVALSDTDFQDITFAGTMTVNSASSVGDCGGNSGTNWNSGVTQIMTPAAPQTWTNAAGGSWSTAGNWSGRVPLPQDDAIMNRVGGYNTGVTVTADMPRFGRNIDWTGATWTGSAPTFSLPWLGSVFIYGSLKLISGMNYDAPSHVYFMGRSNYVITTAGKSTMNMYINAPGGSYTLGDALNTSNIFTLNYGSFSTAGYAFSPSTFISSNTNTRTLDLSNSTVTLTYAAVGNGGALWNTSTTTNMTFNAAGSTFLLPYTGTAATTFYAGGLTFNDIVISSSTGEHTFSGNNTFNNFTATGGRKTIKFTNGSTTTINGILNVSGLNTRGSEIVSDGVFNTGGWNQHPGWSVAGGVATATDAADNQSVWQSSGAGLNGIPCEVTYTINSISSGGFKSDLGGASGAVHTAPGTYSDILVPTSNNNPWPGIHTVGVTTGVIDNFSIKPINTANLVSSTFNSQATISKPSGIVILDNVSLRDMNVAGGARYYYTTNSFNVSNNTGLLTDTTPATNPTTTTANVGGTSVANNGYTNIVGATNFNFSGATDPDSGLVGYYTYFGTDQAAEPLTYQAHSGVEADTQSFSTSISEVDNGKNFYFRVKTKDAVGNIGTAVTLFHFQYDKTAPIRPSFVAATPAGYTIINNFSFTWPAGSDPVGGAGASGVKWYEYKRNVDADWSHTADASSRTVSNIEAYQEGANVFLVRTVDNSGNISPTYQQVTYYYSGSAPAKPTGLTVSPNTSDSNSFTVHWHRPAVDPEDPPVVGYYYSLNATPTLNNLTYVASGESEVTIGPDAFATLQGLNTIYVLAVNSAGSLSYETEYVASATFTCITPAPPTPTSVSLYDSSDRTLDRWMLTTQWIAGAGQNSSTFDHYAIYRSSDGLGYTLLATTTSTAYIDASGLSNSTTYYYNIKAVDNAGKESAQSSTVQKQPTGKYTTPPTILSTPTALNIKSSAATISWATDRASSSIIRYGTTNDGTFSASTGDLTPTTNHSVTILGLNPSTIYYYQVQSLDEDRDYTPDSAYSTTYSLTTGAAPAISETKVENITLTSADISFTTTTVASSRISYGETSSYGSEVEDISGDQATSHTVKLVNLKAGTAYHFKLHGTDIDNNILVSDDYQFDTLPLPQIENLKIEAISNKPASAFKASWTTNVPTTTILKYKAGTDQFKESVKSKSETSHNIEIEDLSDSSEYSIIASGRDSLGNLAESETQKFTTPYDTRPAIISSITVETSNVGLDRQDKAQIAVSWKTDEPTTSMVEYAEGISGTEYTNKSNEDKAMVTNHLVIISNLTPQKPYHLRIVSTDKGNNISQSGDHTVIPGDVPKSALQIILKTFTRLFGWLGL